MAYTYKYPKADHTVDAVVFGIDFDEAALKILLIERAREPFKGNWALPGGFVEMDEDLEAAVIRELREETNIRLSYMEQLYTFGAPGRDPRGRVISTAFLGLVQPGHIAIQEGSDAAKAIWWNVNELPGLAFDHAEIIKTGVQRLRSKISWQPVGIELLPDEFTLSDLQQACEIILGRTIDKRNFRRKVLKFGVLAPTGNVRKENYRPAQLYQFDKKRYALLQKQGIDFEV
ncbi:8-oxo-dGTP diphosphatase [Desulfatibacillum alkenivorans DSM 16219]|jgi:8-oxo-dGTP diphosphatase|uniref:8-oxo-dGTP diphosphatase n=1 Tax=Desulfatibacillum alkenivorans DSM 16219 TaxID=1121393 RepID=A0A1M6MH01_9BACT|nr:NUDIX domain-containing protein [Desulfatibacillum alkenivorans]SHJ82718.1 8-oxo-dGTP diphosphatase [Desulfatibacillum alkenivorans DSM 16219]